LEGETLKPSRRVKGAETAAIAVLILADLDGEAKSLEQTFKSNSLFLILFSYPRLKKSS